MGHLKGSHSGSHKGLIGVQYHIKVQLDHMKLEFKEGELK